MSAFSHQKLAHTPKRSIQTYKFFHFRSTLHFFWRKTPYSRVNFFSVKFQVVLFRSTRRTNTLIFPSTSLVMFTPSLRETKVSTHINRGRLDKYLRCRTPNIRNRLNMEKFCKNPSTFSQSVDIRGGRN